MELTLAFVYHFNKKGKMIDVFVPPAAYIPMRNGSASFSSNTPPLNHPDMVPVPAIPTSGRFNNQGFEGMAYSPDGKLYTILQSALVQDQAGVSKRRNTRMIEWDLQKQEWTGEWVVSLPVFVETNNSTGVASTSEITYLGPNKFLILARDGGKGFEDPVSESLYRHVFHSCVI
jgi:hypothetical protein